jgi:tetratricopeptide (TPR) repeat protein
VHARFFAGKETAVMALWNSPRQREAYTWLTSELSNLRTAFRWASDRDDLDSAAAIAIYATPLGNWIEQHEPNTWAGELIQRAEAVGYRRLPELYVMAAQCCLNGRIEEAISYAEPGRLAIVSGQFETVSSGYETFLMNGYLLAGQPERCVDWCRDVLAQDPGADPPYARLLLAQLLSIVKPDEAKATSEDLLRIADATKNPHVACMALFGYGFVHTNERPDEAYRTLRRGLKLAQDSGNRQYESHFALGLSRLAVTQGEPIDALDFLTVAIRNHHDSGSFAFLLLPLASLGALFERLGLTEPAATVFGFAATPFALATLPEMGVAVSRVRHALGDEAYSSLARVGEAMSHSEAVAYAFEQIDLARAELLQADTSQ